MFPKKTWKDSFFSIISDQDMILPIFSMLGEQHHLLTHSCGPSQMYNYNIYFIVVRVFFNIFVLDKYSLVFVND